MSSKEITTTSDDKDDDGNCSSDTDVAFTSIDFSGVKFDSFDDELPIKVEIEVI